MARRPTVVDPDGIATDDEPTDRELEQAASGDLNLLGGNDYQNFRWSIWRQRTADEMRGDPRAPAWAFVCKRLGPLDADQLRQELGGGVFELRGFVDLGDGRGERLKKKPVIAFDGPRKRWDELPAAAAPAAPAATTTDPTLLVLLDRMDRRLEHLERQPPPQPQPPTDLVQMVGALSALDKLRGPQSAAGGMDPAKTVELMAQMVDRGIDIGTGREPVPVVDGGEYGWLKELIPTANRMLDVLAERWRREGARPAQRPATVAPAPGVPGEPPPARGEGPSYAQVVGEADPATQPPATGEQMNHRWLTAVESLLVEIAEGGDPADFAMTLETILKPNPFDLALLKGASVDQVLGRLTPNLDDQARALVTSERGKTFLAAVLHALNDSGDDSES